MIQKIIDYLETPNLTRIDSGDANMESGYCLVIEEVVNYRQEGQEETDILPLFKLHFLNSIIQVEKYLLTLIKTENEYLLFRFTTKQVFTIGMLPYYISGGCKQYISWNDFFEQNKALNRNLNKINSKTYGIDFEEDSEEVE